MEPNYGIGTGSYTNERDDWRRAVERARLEGWQFLELTAVLEPLLSTLPEFLELSGGLLAGFDRVSLHAPIWAESPADMVDVIAALPLDGDVVFHPDAWAGERALDRLGTRVLFENMDVGKRFGRTVDDLRRVFADHLDAGFCLDVAHVWTNDPSLRLGHDLLDAIGDRLRQLHVSGIERDGSHRPTTHADLELYQPLLDRCGTVPWILETIVEA
jgi:sugar phosphate isomerase/epimerase